MTDDLIRLADYAKEKQISIEEARKQARHAGKYETANGTEYTRLSLLNEQETQKAETPKEKDTAELDELKKENAELRKLIQDKDKQIADFALQFAELAKQAQQIAGQAQILQLQEATRQGIEASTPAENPAENIETRTPAESPAETKKKGLFARIFGKR